MRLMEEAASKNERVLAEPPPKALLLRFADSGIDLELGVWIEDPENGVLGIRSELYLDIWRAYQEAGTQMLIFSSYQNDVETQELFAAEVMPKFTGG